MKQLMLDGVPVLEIDDDLAEALRRAAVDGGGKQIGAPDVDYQGDAQEIRGALHDPNERVAVKHSAFRTLTLRFGFFSTWIEAPPKSSSRS